MKKFFLLIFTLSVSAKIFPQDKPKTLPPDLPPEVMEMIKQMMPAGSTLPGKAGASEAAKPLIDLPPVQEYSYTPQPSSPTNMSPFGSGRTEAQRKAALFAVNAELENKPYLLPKKESAPSKKDMLQIASERYKSAHQKLGPDDLIEYSKAVIWTPRFDGLYPDSEKAKQYSLFVSVATNYFNRPYYVMALASAVFSLDPQSTVNANNFASAIIAAGERLNPAPAKAEEITPYRKDAEAGFLYAIAISMKGDAWTNESLTAILNLGNLYIDMGKLEEARSLFQVARKLSPYSWDAALGMAAYFYAIGQPDKALAILEDDALDRPEKYLIAVKSANSLEKSDKFSELPAESPDQVYEEGIKVMAAEPIATAADFIAQLDQSERNKMRYFIENLPPAGSFTAPSIKILIQYASLKAISSPQGISALRNFRDMLGMFRMSSLTSTANQQIEWLAKLGLKIDSGVDFNDMAMHPEKYADKKTRPKVKVSGIEELKANAQNMRKQAEAARRDLATDKTASTVAMAAQIDPFFTILQIDPDRYADPMNILMQRFNFAVFNRKTNLYNGYLYSVNKRTYNTVVDIVKQTQTKIDHLKTLEDAELAQFQKQEEEAREQAEASGARFPSAEWKLKKHAIHTKYFSQFNNAAETGFNSATNVVSIAYIKKIKPTAEAFYQDIIRHVALISDPDVRIQKDAVLRSSINSALVFALQTVLVAHSSFSYSHDWDCDCNIEALLRQREEEQAALDAEENARIMRNKAAKARFDTGEIPESTPLFKKLDSFGTDFNHVFIKGRVSCARTIVKLNVTLPIPGFPEFFASQSTSEFTGASTYGGGVKVGIGAKEGDVKAGAYFNLSGSVSTNGQGVVKDYSVTAATGVKVSAKGTSISVGGELTFGPNGLKDSDFSAGIKKDFGNEMGGEGEASIQASTKRGCSLSGKVEQSLSPVKDFVDAVKTKAIGKDAAKLIPTDDFLKKETWSGKYVIGK